MKIHPADPADTTSSAINTVQAGNVWFPDSARKTADSLADFQRENLPCFILANWRGFSGGMRDMFDEVLKFGADIVDNLTKFTQPVFIYLPPRAELRGGAWVVLDTAINPEFIEMYSDVTARGGILEPTGIIEVKYREREVIQTIHRLDNTCKELLQKIDQKKENQEEVKQLQKDLKARVEFLLPVYKTIAVQFADLHDKPGRMLAKGAIRSVVPWQESRQYFYKRLQRRRHEVCICKRMQPTSNVQVMGVIKDQVMQAGVNWDDDEAVWKFLTTFVDSQSFKNTLAANNAQSIAASLQESLAQCGDAQAQIELLRSVLAGVPPEQLQQLMAPEAPTPLI
eukprot:TRINITY_DN75945_c0_g1_i1.p1 TRINITY_DN75945_c0_g1~~TRINITY_DN75945_c0_g1_i1.p1  ORF type:complete len:400 (-),score=32.40 TRINITY_DN75945_c0_g1_i1:42-1061(-)